MTGIIWNGSRRRLIGTTTAVLAATAGLPAVLAVPAGAQGTPETTPTTTTATTTGAIDLSPTPPAALGAPEVPAATVSTQSDAAPAGPILEPYAGYGTDAAPGVFPRTIRHAFGETTIETKPERIVVLDAGELDTAMYLGIVPVGSVEFEASRFPEELAERSKAITIVGTLAEPDIEAILALKPDLIISSKLRHDETIYTLLAAIAPTVFALQPGVTFKHNFALYAQAMGMEVEARAFIDRYDNAVRALNAKLPVPRPTTAIVQIRSDQVRYYQRANFLGLVLTDLGFPRNAAQNVDDFAFIGGQEQLGAYADAEFVILTVLGDEENELGAEILGGDVWASLPAVQAGNVMEGPSEKLIAGVSYGSALEVLALIAAHFGIDPVLVEE